MTFCLGSSVTNSSGVEYRTQKIKDRFQIGFGYFCKNGFLLTDPGKLIKVLTGQNPTFWSWQTDKKVCSAESAD